MTIGSWSRRLFARPVTRPMHKAPARCRPRLEALAAFAHRVSRCLASTFTDATGRQNGDLTSANLATRRTTVDFPLFFAGYLRRRPPVALLIFKGFI